MCLQYIMLWFTFVYTGQVRRTDIRNANEGRNLVSFDIMKYFLSNWLLSECLIHSSGVLWNGQFTRLVGSAINCEYGWTLDTRKWGAWPPANFLHGQTCMTRILKWGLWNMNLIWELCKCPEKPMLWYTYTSWCENCAMNFLVAYITLPWPEVASWNDTQRLMTHDLFVATSQTTNLTNPFYPHPTCLTHSSSPWQGFIYE